MPSVHAWRTLLKEVICISLVMNTHEPKKNKDELHEFLNPAPDGEVPV